MALKDLNAQLNELSMALGAIQQVKTFCGAANARLSTAELAGSIILLEEVAMLDKLYTRIKNYIESAEGSPVALPDVPKEAVP